MNTHFAVKFLVFIKSGSAIMGERMEKPLLTKSQRELEINEIFYLNLRQKEEHSSIEGNCASSEIGRASCRERV